MIILKRSTEVIKRQLSKEKNGKPVEIPSSIELALCYLTSKTAAQIEGTPLAELGQIPINEADIALVGVYGAERAIGMASEVLGVINEAVDDARAIGSLWAPLFEKVGDIMKIVDGLADVRKYQISSSC
jgi:hypothetical protein